MAAPAVPSGRCQLDDDKASLQSNAEGGRSMTKRFANMLNIAMAQTTSSTELEMKTRYPRCLTASLAVINRLLGNHQSRGSSRLRKSAISR